MFPNNQWWTSPLNAITNYLFPPLPSGAPSNPQTAAYGQQGSSFGMAPSFVIQTTAANGTAGIGTTTPLPSTATQTATAPVGSAPPGYAPFANQAAPKQPIGGSGGTVRTQGTRTTAQTTTATPPPPAPLTPDPESDYYARQSNVSQTTGTDNFGNEQPVIVPANEVATSGANSSDMIAMGYVWNPDQQNWVLNPQGDRNAYWRTSGSNFGQQGAKGQVHGQSFMSEKAYQTWLNRKKKDSKKEETEGMKQASQYVTSTFGTG